MSDIEKVVIPPNNEAGKFVVISDRFGRLSESAHADQKSAEEEMEKFKIIRARLTENIDVKQIIMG